MIAAGKAGNRLVGVHQRNAQRVGHVLLGQGKRPVPREPALPRAVQNEDKQIGDFLQRRSPANGQEMVVEHAFLTRSDPGDVVGEFGKLLVERKQLGLLEHA